MGGDFIITNYGPISSAFARSLLVDLCVPGVGVQTGPFGSQLHASDYVERGTPIITVEHIGDNRIIHDNLPFVSDEDRTRLSKYSLKKGDIVFSRVGSVDRRAIVHLNEDGWLFSGRCLRVRPDRNKIDPGYLSWFMGLPGFKEYIRQIAVGATMPSLNTAILSKVVIFFPPSLKDQQAIACILGTLDDKIEINRRMNQTLEVMARAIFKSWFVDFDPVRAKAAGQPPPGQPPHIAELFPDSFVDSELGEIPRGWRIGKIQDLGEVICGKTPPTSEPDNYGDDVPFVTIPDMHGKVFVTATGKSLSKKGAATQKNKFLPPFSICVSCIATPGIVALTSIYCQTNQQINSVVPSDPNSSLFCYFVLRGLGDQIRSHGAGGSVLLNLNKGQFSLMKTILPPANESLVFHNITLPIFMKILVNQKQCEILESIRDTLLPKLISGELRVPDAERIVGRCT
ncbi:MAG: hypothetical protein FJ135_04345 [Deltaproteobacteria bacterium]|nr:hypothetical protein [Deltaproteobacteria bacterium]